MAPDDVSNFVVEHAGYFGLVFGCDDQPRIHVEKAAGNGEPIELCRIVQYGNTVGGAGAIYLCPFDQGGRYALHIALYVWVV